jgi:hypothetical protein
MDTQRVETAGSSKTLVTSNEPTYCHNMEDHSLKKYYPTVYMEATDNHTKNSLRITGLLVMIQTQDLSYKAGVLITTP